MSNRRRFLGVAVVVVIALVVGAGVLLRIRSNTAEADSTNVASSGDRPAVSASETFASDVPIPVRGAEVVLDTLIISVTANGNAAALRETKVTAQIEGRVQAVNVDNASRVSRSQVLVRIDSVDHAFALQRARAELEQAQAQFRQLTLFDDREPDSTIRAERARAARLTSGLDLRQLAVDEAELQLSRVRIAAPFAGSVASVHVVPGQWVTAGTELMTLQEIDPIKVEVNVLEGEVGLLQAGSRAAVSFAAFPGETFRGRIVSINPVVDPVTRTATVTVHVPNNNRRILPGMYARVSLDARKFPNRLLVPRAAVLERDVDRRTLVFVFEEGRAKWRYVTLGLGNDSLVEVIEGEPGSGTFMVEPGEIVLVDGHHTLTHDARITLVENVQAAGGRPQ